MFELNFRDERYLPLKERAPSAGGHWSCLPIFLQTTRQGQPGLWQPLRQFDYGTISDAILHVKYTAREDAGPFKNSAVTNLRDYFRETVATPSQRLLNLRQEFPSQWHRFLTPTSPTGPNIFEFEMSHSLFQIKDMGKTIKINAISILARCADPGIYEVELTPRAGAGSNTFSLPKLGQYGGLHFGQKDVSGLQVVPTDSPALWQLRMTRGGNNLREDEVEDLVLVLGYQLDLA